MTTTTTDAPAETSPTLPGVDVAPTKPVKEPKADKPPKEPKADKPVKEPKAPKAPKTPAAEAAVTIPLTGLIDALDERLVIAGVDDYGSDHALSQANAGDEPPLWMINSVEESGVRTPIEITPDPKTPGNFLIVAGRTRLKAARVIAKKLKKAKKPPLMIPYFMSSDAYEERKAFTGMVQENVLRRSVNWDENVENAVKAKALGYSVKAIAEELYQGQVTVTQVYSWIAYHEKAHPLMKEAVREGRATPTAILEYTKGDLGKDPEKALKAFEADLKEMAEGPKKRADSKLNNKTVAENNAKRGNADAKKEPPAVQTTGITLGELGNLMTRWDLMKKENKLPEHLEALLDFVKVIKGEASYARIKGLKAAIDDIRA